MSQWYSRACEACRGGLLSESIAALCAGLEAGEWWSPALLDEDADLDGLRGAPDFEAIRSACAERHAAAVAAARPVCRVLTSASSLWEEQCLLLIHGRGMPAPLLRDRFLPLVDDGWTLVSLQSSQPFGSDGFCWDDVEKGREEIRTQLEECRRTRGLELGRLVIVGASQGARLGVEIARETAVPWIGVIPHFPRDFDPQGTPGAWDRGVLLVGAEDAAASRARSVARMLESGGAAVRFIEMPGVAHALPDDLADHARAALEWITGISSRSSAGTGCTP